MKSKLTATLFFLSAVALSFIAGVFTERAGWAPRPPGRYLQNPAGMMNPFGTQRDRKDFFLKIFSEQLALTATQQDSLKKILERHQPRFEALRQEIYPRFVSLREEIFRNVRAILTEAQREKLATMTRDIEENMNK